MTTEQAMPRFLLFLDFDGVLHPVNANEHERFKPDSIREVNRILDVLHANVVLSTAWRMDFGIDRFNSWFNGRVIAITPVHDMDMQRKFTRFHEITDFLTVRGWQNIPWIAVDDKKSHFPGDSPAYITNAGIGLTACDADNIIFTGKCMNFMRRSMLNF